MFIVGVACSLLALMQQFSHPPPSPPFLRLSTHPARRVGRRHGHHGTQGAAPDRPGRHCVCPRRQRAIRVHVSCRQRSTRRPRRCGRRCSGGARVTSAASTDNTRPANQQCLRPANQQCRRPCATSRGGGPDRQWRRRWLDCQAHQGMDFCFSLMYLLLTPSVWVGG